MALSPKKLKAYIALERDESHEDEKHEAEETPEHEAAEHEGEEELAEALEEAESEEESDDAAYEDFVSDLYTHAAALDEAASAIEAPLTHDMMPDEETVAQMREQLGEMPESIQQGVAEYLVGVPYAEVVELAEDLAEEEAISDVEQVAGWLYWIAKNVAA